MHQDAQRPAPSGDPAGPPPASAPSSPAPAPAHEAAGGAAGFRLAVVPGVNPAKWLRVWEQRLPAVRLALVQVTAAEAEREVREGRVDAALLRVPVDRSALSAIPLYTETSVVVVPTDHLVVAAEEVTTADLADDVLLRPADDVLAWDLLPGAPSALPAPPTTADAVELVAAGVGVLVVPQSLARLHHRRDLTYRPVTDAPTSSVGLAWRTEGAPELVEELIGIVRGRTVNSSRGRAGGIAPKDADAPSTGGPGAGRAGSRSGADAGGRGRGGRDGAAGAGGRGASGAGGRGASNGRGPTGRGRPGSGGSGRTGRGGPGGGAGRGGGGKSSGGKGSGRPR